MVQVNQYKTKQLYINQLSVFSKNKVYSKNEKLWIAIFLKSLVSHLNIKLDVMNIFFADSEIDDRSIFINSFMTVEPIKVEYIL